MTLLQVQTATVCFRAAGSKQGFKAVDAVDLSVGEGEVVGLVGESGCGKTTLGNAIVGLAPLSSGSILFRGDDVSTLSSAAMSAYRRSVQMIFQDPFSSLNPRLTVGAALEEVLRVHRLAAGRDGRTRAVAALLASVGMPAEAAGRYPHEFSGGQRQRIGIARALAVEPALIVADEPVSALDVSVQVQILNLLRDLQQRRGLAYLFVAHDLAVVRYMADRVLVMYKGRLVEWAPAERLYARPAHPYTEALLAAVPDVERGLERRAKGEARIVLSGDVPPLQVEVPGCPFHPRCHRAQPLCRQSAPEAVMLDPLHGSRCHFAAQIDTQTADT